MSERATHSQVKTRVMHISLGTAVGGMEKLLVEFAKFTDRTKFDLSFASLQNRGSCAALIEACNWPVFEFDKQAGIQPRLVTKLAKRLRQSCIDVVHTHNTSAFIYGVLSAKLVGVERIIHTRHGQRLGASSRQTLLFKLLSRWARRVISVSHDGSQLSIREGVSPHRVCTIHNGIDLHRFEFVGTQPFGPAVLVARLAPEKDVATLLRAMPSVLSQLALETPRCLLEIVGDGVERPALQALSRELDIHSYVRFLGQQDNIPQVLSRASMFVLPSVSEGVSLTLLEAMACGLPVVATRVGGTPEVVDEGVTGWLVPPGAANEFATAMLRLYTDPGAGQRMGQLGRKRVEQLFSIERMVHAYEHEYLQQERL